MSNIFFTADLHFHHKNILKFCPTTRHGDDVKQMNELLVQSINSRVKADDTLYILGDLGFGKPSAIMAMVKRLNGVKHLIRGNHDDHLYPSDLHGVFETVTDQKTIKVGGHEIYMHHFSHRVWNKAHHGAWHLHGHSHGALENWYKSMDVGIDARPLGDMLPFSFDEIKAVMDQQPILGHHDA